MSKAAINVGCEHVGHGTDGCLLELGHMSLQRVSMDRTQDRPVNVVQGMDQVHELREVSE